MHPLTGSSLDDFSDSTPSQDQSIDDVVPKCLLPVAATTPLSLLLKALEIAGIDLKENTLVLSAVEISPNLRSYLAKKHPGVPFAEVSERPEHVVGKSSPPIPHPFSLL